MRKTAHNQGRGFESEVLSEHLVSTLPGVWPRTVRTEWVMAVDGLWSVVAVVVGGSSMI
jgi:hypothetical protein